MSQHVGVLYNQNGTKKHAAVVNCLFIPVLSVVIVLLLFGLCIVLPSYSFCVRVSGLETK